MILKKENTCLVVFNMQLELIPLLKGGTQLLHDCRWAVEVAKSLEVPTLVIEQKKLGAPAKTLQEVADGIPYLEKIYFDFLAHSHIEQEVEKTGCNQFVLAGGETHVCLLQSAVGLLNKGKEVFVLSDTCSSRNVEDHEAGIARMKKMPIHLMTKEMFFFEIIRNSEYPNYIDLAMKYLDGRYIK